MDHIKHLTVKQLRQVLTKYNKVVKVPKVSKMKRSQLEKKILELFDIDKVPSDDTMNDFLIKLSLKPDFNFNSIESHLLDAYNDKENKENMRRSKSSNIDSVLSNLKYINNKDNYKSLPDKIETVRDILRRRKRILSDKKNYRKIKNFKKIKDWIPKEHLATVLKRIGKV